MTSLPKNKQKNKTARRANCPPRAPNALAYATFTGRPGGLFQWLFLPAFYPLSCLPLIIPSPAAKKCVLYRDDSSLMFKAAICRAQAATHAQGLPFKGEKNVESRRLFAPALQKAPRIFPPGLHARASGIFPNIRLKEKISMFINKKIALASALALVFAGSAQAVELSCSNPSIQLYTGNPADWSGGELYIP